MALLNSKIGGNRYKLKSGNMLLGIGIVQIPNWKKLHTHFKVLSKS